MSVSGAKSVFNDNDKMEVPDDLFVVDDPHLLVRLLTRLSPGFAALPPPWPSALSVPLTPSPLRSQASIDQRR